MFDMPLVTHELQTHMNTNNSASQTLAEGIRYK